MHVYSDIFHNFEISFKFKMRFEWIVGEQNWVYGNILYRWVPVNHAILINMFFTVCRNDDILGLNTEFILVRNLPHIRNLSLKSLFVLMKGFVISTLCRHTIRQVSKSIIMMRRCDMAFNTRRYIIQYTQYHATTCWWLYAQNLLKIPHTKIYLSLQYLSYLPPWVRHYMLR